MAIVAIDTTTPQPNGKFGEPNRTAFEKINSNFVEVAGDLAGVGDVVAEVEALKLEIEQDTAAAIAELEQETAAAIAAIDVSIMVGTFANRPSAASVNGREYYATDVKERYTPVNGQWLVLPSGGTELGYAQRTTTFTTTTAGIDVPGMIITYVAGVNPAIVEWGGTYRVNGTDTVVLAVQADGVQVGQILTPAGGFTSHSRLARISGKTPGATVTVKLRLTAFSGATADLFGDATDPAYLRVSTS